MREEIRDMTRSAGKLGATIKEAADIAPIALANLIELGTKVVELPWSVIVGTTDFAATKVDDTVEMVV